MSKLFTVAMCGLLLSGIASAQGVFYVSAVGATNGNFAPAGATPGGTGQITKMVGDDIHVNPIWAGQPIRYFFFSVFNANAGIVSSRPRVRFYQDNGVAAGPTGINDPATYMSGFSFNAIAFPVGISYYSAAVPVTTGLNIQPNGRLWQGWLFDNFGATTGATETDLNNLGMGTAVADSGIPAFLDSTDAYFTSNAAPVYPNSFVGAIAPGAVTQATFGAGTSLDLDLGVMAQNYNFNLTLNDVTSPAYAKTMNITVAAGNVVLADYYLFTYAAAGSPTGALAIRCPARLPVGASNPVTITIDGGQFLKRKFDVTLPAAPNDAPVAIVVPDVNMTNGDVDGSGEVDAVDIDQVIADFGALITAETDTQADSDVDISGEVDATDIDIVIANFGAIDD